MKPSAVLVGYTLVAFCLSGTIVAPSALAAPTFQATLHSTTTAVFLGDTRINTTFTGFPLDAVLNASFLENMNAFTLLGGNTIAGLQSVIVAENIDIHQVSSLEELYQLYADHLESFTDCQIVTDLGLFLLGYPTGGSIDVQSHAEYAISSFRPFTLNHTAIPFFLMATQTPVTLVFSGAYAVLAQINASTIVQIQDQQGKTLWNGLSGNTYFFIQDQRFQINQQPPLSLFPLNPEDSTSPPFSYSVTPADPRSVHLQELLDSMTAQATQVTNTDVAKEFQMVLRSDMVISSAGFLANGAVILGNTTDTIQIDHQTQSFENIGILRFHDLSVSYNSPDEGPTIQGTYSLVYLGDHFYNPQAKDSTNGIAFPFMLLIVWVIALAGFLYVRFFLRPQVQQQKDAYIKKYSLWIHLALLIVGVFLLDWEVNIQLGTSALTSLASSGASVVTGVLFGLEFLIGVLGYVLLAIPVRLLTMSGLRILHIGKGGRGIEAGVGDFSIGIFTSFYLLLFVNILISAFNLPNFLMAG